MNNTNESKTTLENNILWKDRKRYFGLPISFTKYSVSNDRLFLETGLLNLKEEDILLYRVKDISLGQKLSQRIFGCGSVFISSSDETQPELEIKNIKKPKETKELIHKLVEEAKEKKHLIISEGDHNCNHE